MKRLAEIVNQQNKDLLVPLLHCQQTSVLRVGLNGMNLLGMNLKTKKLKLQQNSDIEFDSDQIKHTQLPLNPNDIFYYDDNETEKEKKKKQNSETTKSSQSEISNLKDLKWNILPCFLIKDSDIIKLFNDLPKSKLFELLNRNKTWMKYEQQAQQWIDGTNINQTQGTQILGQTSSSKSPPPIVITQQTQNPFAQLSVPKPTSATKSASSTSPAQANTIVSTSPAPLVQKEKTQSSSPPSQTTQQPQTNYIQIKLDQKVSEILKSKVTQEIWNKVENNWNLNKSFLINNDISGYSGVYTHPSILYLSISALRLKPGHRVLIVGRDMFLASDIIGELIKPGGVAVSVVPSQMGENCTYYSYSLQYDKKLKVISNKNKIKNKKHQNKEKEKEKENGKEKENEKEKDKSIKSQEQITNIPSYDFVKNYPFAVNNFILPNSILALKRDLFTFDHILVLEKIDATSLLHLASLLEDRDPESSLVYPSVQNGGSLKLLKPKYEK
ncbi:MAG: hypothetical protein EZS28_026345 [Streblomastix strix]|uniref:Uncharacterized protein n=1 Tax=Streblomastix strix TaxID=222440 RepID=A0A5J4V5X7_9EUKA|nr:MAG: hypothetical protein EZS28_026345 [Streblomastix strix]